jgi:RNA polymerase sigma-70 factor (ECF subfamily)
MIARGMFHLAQSATDEELSEYHLEAAIAACHSTAKDYASTDWRRILGLYDLLVQSDRSAVVALNRAVALAEVHGPQAGLEAVRNIPDVESLENYYLLHVVLGEFELRLQHFEEAAMHFRNALELTETKPEQALVNKKLATCNAQLEQTA